MADPLTGLNGFLGSFQAGFGDPLSMGISVILSTIIGGIAILIVVEIFAKKFSEQVSPQNAFLLALIASLINLFGIVPLLANFLVILPFAGLLIMLLPIIVWFVLVKMFFGEMSMLHVLMISVICYLLSIYLIPMLVNMAFAFVPAI